MIRKQFRQAVKTQTRQYRALERQLLSQIPREEHKEMIGRLKEEQKRKFAQLAEQYDGTVGEMVTKQTVRD